MSEADMFVQGLVPFVWIGTMREFDDGSPAAYNGGWHDTDRDIRLEHLAHLASHTNPGDQGERQGNPSFRSGPFGEEGESRVIEFY